MLAAISTRRTGIDVDDFSAAEIHPTDMSPVMFARRRPRSQSYREPLNQHLPRDLTYIDSGKQMSKRKKRRMHSNTVEGYFSIFKRGMKGIYQHCGEQHLHRYLAEYEFRYNNREALGCNDTDRTVASLQGIVGKRLTYRRIDA
jgi:hypothetical protein